MAKRKKKEPELVKPLESLLSAEFFGPDILALEKEQEELPVPFTLEVVNNQRDYKKVSELSYRFAYGSQTIHISREDVLSFFQNSTIVLDTISNEDAKKADRAVELILTITPIQNSLHIFTNALILIQTSSLELIDMKELETIMTFFVSNLSKNASIKYGIGTREYLGSRIRLLVACN